MPRGFVIYLLSLGLLVGCGGELGKGGAGTGPASIAVSISPSISMVSVAGTQNFTAVVANDPSGKGLTWSISGCEGGAIACGSLSSASTSSGATTTYTAPSVVASNLQLQIVATSLSDPSRSAMASVTVSAGNANNSKLSGHYAFLFQGFGECATFMAAGSFVADGSGGINSGILDTTGTGFNAGYANCFGSNWPRPLNSFVGSYSIASTGTGTLTLTSSFAGQVVLHFALTADGNAKFIEFDDSTGTGTVGSGTIKKQDVAAFSTARLSGDYIFAFTGWGNVGGGRASIAGQFHADGATNITNGVLDFNAGVPSGPATITGASYGVSDATHGRAVFTILASSIPGFNGGFVNLACYIVDAANLFCVATSSVQSVSFGGSILQQQTPAGGFSLASLDGTGVLHTTSSDDPLITSGASVGLFTGNGNGTFLLMQDDHSGLTNSFTGTYTVATNGRAVVAYGTTTTILYLSKQNEGFWTGADGAVTSGFLQPQTTGPFNNATLSGTFLANTDLPTIPINTNDSGLATFDGTNNISITVDENYHVSGSPVPEAFFKSNQTFIGTYSVSPNGRGTVTAPLGPTQPALNLIFYIVSPTQIVAITEDPLSPVVIEFSQ